MVIPAAKYENMNIRNEKIDYMETHDSSDGASMHPSLRLRRWYSLDPMNSALPFQPSYAPIPLTSTQRPTPPPSLSFFSIISAFHFIACAYLKYTLSKSPKNKLASEPPHQT